MTINLSDNSPRISYTVASGVTQSSFTVPFEFFEEGDLNVYVDGTLKTITTDYTVSGGSGSTGTIAMTVVGASGGSTVVLTRSIPLERTTDFPTSGPFDVASLNEELDRITAINADLNDEVNRSLRLTDGDAAANLTIPTAANRAGKVLAFDLITGDLVNGPSTAGVTTIAAAAADIATLADIQDGTVATNAITDAAAIKTNINTVAGIAANVTTVAGNTANVNTVAGINADVTTVAGNNANVTTVADISGNVTTAAGISADITAVAADATDIGTVSTNIANVNTVAGISANVTTVAADGADIGVVAGISSDVTTVSGISANVTSVAGNASNINAVAADATDIGTVVTNIANVNTTATNIANVNSVAGNSTNINAVAADATDIGTVATNIANVNTAAGISANITTVAGIAADVTAAATNASDISAIAAEVAKVVTVANDLNEATSEIDTVANSIANVDLVGASIADVNTVASNLSGITAFADVYASGLTDPTTNLNEGDLFFNTTSDTLKVYDGSAWVAGVTAGSGFLPLSGGQLTGNLTFPSTQTVDGRDVSVDGAKLDGIEAGATADQTAAEIRALVESATDSNVFTDADHTKLNGIESGATADQSASEILTAIKTVDGSGSGLDADLLDGVDSGSFLRSDVADTKTSGDLSFADNVKAQFGASNDLQIYHNGANSIIADVGAGNLYLAGSIVGMTNAAATYYTIKSVEGGAVELYHNAAIKLQTTNYGAHVTGDVTFNDGGKATFGGGSDFQIFHDGYNTYLTETGGVGNVYLRGNNLILLNNANEFYINCVSDGAVTLYHNNAAKLSTTASGVSVTGTLSATSITGNGSGLTNLPAPTLTNSTTIPSEGGGLNINVTQTLTKTWGKFSTGFTSINDSFNISSLDDDGTGNGGINFSSNFNNANYSSSMNLVWTIGQGYQLRCWGADSQATSSFEFSTGYVQSGGYWIYYDADMQPSVQLNGDLA